MRTPHPAMMLAGLGLMAVAGCEPTPPPDPAWQKPPRYGQGGTESPRPADRRSNRFGYTGDEPVPDRRDAPVQTPGNSPTVAGNNNAASSTPGNQQTPSATPPAPKPPEKKPQPAVETMPYARGVPGNPLAVTLPAPYDKLGPISVEKYDASGNATGEAMAPGTPVEIKDPNNPGKKIRFRVP